ncbi:MAG: hypothetical protein RJB26_461, partial [Pseudomonadota bacterium]
MTLQRRHLLPVIACAFLALVPDFAGAKVPAASTAPETTPAADLVFTHGAVYTLDAARSWASAVAARGGKVVYVGTDEGASAFIGQATRTVDLRGRMLLPSFQDSHAHPSQVPNPANQLDLEGLQDREQLFARIRAFATAHPGNGWIVGGGWDEAAFLPSGRPTRQMLDAIVSNRPVFLINNSRHQAWVNTAALKAAGVTRETPNPPNGEVVREANGE